MVLILDGMDVKDNVTLVGPELEEISPARRKKERMEDKDHGLTSKRRPIKPMVRLFK